MLGEGIKGKKKGEKSTKLGRGIRERNVGSSRDGRLYFDAWIKRAKGQMGVERKNKQSK